MTRARPSRPLGRLVNKADFERLLAVRSSGRSAHFALHHVNASPVGAKRPSSDARPEQLSTGPAPVVAEIVDKLPQQVWFGCVVPKRHARRAVTRNLLKRQVRGAFQRYAERLAAGLWLVRLRSPFATAEFVSAKSTALAKAACCELDGLLAQAAA